MTTFLVVVSGLLAAAYDWMPAIFGGALLVFLVLVWIVYDAVLAERERHERRRARREHEQPAVQRPADDEVRRAA